MNTVFYPGTVIGTGLILAIVFADNIGKHNTDKPRPFFMAALGALLFAIFADSAIVILEQNTFPHFNVTGFVWIFATAAVLYVYFGIISQDQKTDALTGIGNRYSFNEFIERLSVRRAGRSVFRESWAVVIIDMDRFKEINDTLGHPEGDNALRDMAKIIKGCIRRSDFAARYGGDEFVLAARAETNIEKLIARLRKEIESHNMTEGRPYKLRISYGYDIFDTGGQRTINEFLEHIDTMMYKHKEEKRRISDRIKTERAK